MEILVSVIRARSSYIHNAATANRDRDRPPVAQRAQQL
jgi:hypothetical protein